MKDEKSASGRSGFLKEYAERRLSVEEFNAYVNAPMTAEEAEGIRELVEWFTRRYPTPLERLAYVRRASRRTFLQEASLQSGIAPGGLETAG
jgi:hypothetical protein